jgi:hypothetical protein
MEKPSTPPSTICANDRVLLHYAILNDSVSFAPGHRLPFVGQKEIGKITCLAICRDKEPPALTLYFCDNDWSPIEIAACESVEAAKTQAELIYPGSSVCWVEVHFSEEEVSHFVDGVWAVQRCSFCGRLSDEALFTSFGGNEGVRICDQCIRKFSSQLGNSKD